MEITTKDFQRDIIIVNIFFINGLKHNLISVSQFSDNNYDVVFKKEKCLITNRKVEKLALNGVRKRNIFVADQASIGTSEVSYFSNNASSINSWLWYNKLSHLNFK